MKMEKNGISTRESYFIYFFFVRSIISFQIFVDFSVRYLIKLFVYA